MRSEREREMKIFQGCEWEEREREKTRILEGEFLKKGRERG